MAKWRRGNKRLQWPYWLLVNHDPGAEETAPLEPPDVPEVEPDKIPDTTGQELEEQPDDPDE